MCRSNDTYTHFNLQFDVHQPHRLIPSLSVDHFIHQSQQSSLPWPFLNLTHQSLTIEDQIGFTSMIRKYLFNDIKRLFKLRKSVISDSQAPILSDTPNAINTSSINGREGQSSVTGEESLITSKSKEHLLTKSVISPPSTHSVHPSPSVNSLTTSANSQNISLIAHPSIIQSHEALEKVKTLFGLNPEEWEMLIELLQRKRLLIKCQIELICRYQNEQQIIQNYQQQTNTLYDKPVEHQPVSESSIPILENFCEKRLNCHQNDSDLHLNFANQILIHPYLTPIRLIIGSDSVSLLRRAVDVWSHKEEYFVPTVKSNQISDELSQLKWNELKCSQHEDLSLFIQLCVGSQHLDLLNNQNDNTMSKFQKALINVWFSYLSSNKDSRRILSKSIQNVNEIIYKFCVCESHRFPALWGTESLTREKMIKRKLRLVREKEEIESHQFDSIANIYDRRRSISTSSVTTANDGTPNQQIRQTRHRTATRAESRKSNDLTQNDIMSNITLNSTKQSIPPNLTPLQLFVKQSLSNIRPLSNHLSSVVQICQLIDAFVALLFQLDFGVINFNNFILSPNQTDYDLCAMQKKLSAIRCHMTDSQFLKYFEQTKLFIKSVVVESSLSTVESMPRQESTNSRSPTNLLQQFNDTNESGLSQIRHQINSVFRPLSSIPHDHAIDNFLSTDDAALVPLLLSLNDNKKQQVNTALQNECASIIIQFRITSIENDIQQCMKEHRNYVETCRRKNKDSQLNVISSESIERVSPIAEALLQLNKYAVTLGELVNKQTKQTLSDDQSIVKSYQSSQPKDPQILIGQTELLRALTSTSNQLCSLIDKQQSSSQSLVLAQRDKTMSDLGIIDSINQRI